MEALTPRVPEFAHYYGDWIWDEELTGWIKSLLLYFDGIALALPPETANRLIASNPVLAQPLAELGLLRNYEPDRWLTPYPETNALANAAEIGALVGELVLDEGKALSAPDRRTLYRTAFELGRRSLVDGIIATLNAAFPSEAQPFMTDPLMRALTVRTTSMLLRAHITDVAIEPVINNENAAWFAATIIGSHDAGRAKIVIGDLAQVGIDLSAVPLDEVLDFRSKYGSEYRRYSDDVRKFVLELSLMDKADQHSALMDRRAELDDRAEQLRKIGRTAFARQTIAFSFGVAGAAWLLKHGDPWGAAFAAGAATAGITRSDRGTIGAAYTYILRANTELTR